MHAIIVRADLDLGLAIAVVGRERPDPVPEVDVSDEPAAFTQDAPVVLPGLVKCRALGDVSHEGPLDGAVGTLVDGRHQ
jgi:hypothetical protein